MKFQASKFTILLNGCGDIEDSVSLLTVSTTSGVSLAGGLALDIDEPDVDQLPSKAELQNSATTPTTPIVSIYYLAPLIFIIFRQKKYSLVGVFFPLPDFAHDARTSCLQKRWCLVKYICESGTAIR